MGSLAESHPSMAVQGQRRSKSSDAQHHVAIAITVQVYFDENKHKIVCTGVTLYAESDCFGSNEACNATR